jgi:hypothetical protein
MRVAFISLAIVALCGCPPGAVSPSPDADSAVAPPIPTVPSADCAAACTAVAQTGCPEGKYSDCAITCTKLQQDPGMPHPNTACLGAAKTAADVRGCGWACLLTFDAR